MARKYQKCCLRFTYLLDGLKDSRKGSLGLGLAQASLLRNARDEFRLLEIHNFI